MRNPILYTTMEFRRFLELDESRPLGNEGAIRESSMRDMLKKGLMSGAAASALMPVDGLFLSPLDGVEHLLCDIAESLGFRPQLGVVSLRHRPLQDMRG